MDYAGSATLNGRNQASFLKKHCASATYKSLGDFKCSMDIARDPSWSGTLCNQDKLQPPLCDSYDNAVSKMIQAIRNYRHYNDESIPLKRFPRLLMALHFPDPSYTGSSILKRTLSTIR